MFRFEHIEYLYYLSAIPVLLIFFYLYQIWKKKAFEKIGDPHLVRRIIPRYSNAKSWIKAVLFLLGISFLIVGWANPQWGTKKEKVIRKGVDVFIALDISRSMLAEDVPPNRLERSKRFCQKLVRELRGERIGLILFAGNAYMQMPLTTDYAAADIFIKSANPNQAPNQGTAISDAIDIAERSFDTENKKHKVLVVISDGESHDEGTIERARQAAGNGLIIYTVGVGSEKGGFIPLYIGGQQNYQRDETGKPVRTVLNESMLKDIAGEANGSYFNLLSSDGIFSDLENKIESMEKREFEEQSFSEYESYFQYFIGLGLILIFINLFITNKRSALADRSVFDL